MGEPPCGYPSALYSPEFKPKEHAFQLYAHPKDTNTRSISGGYWALNWHVYDGPKPDAKLVARLQGICGSDSKSNEDYKSIVDLVFSDERFPSTLKFAGSLKRQYSPPVEMTIVGGTGKFAMAQGTVMHNEFSHEGPRMKELRIRAMVPTLGKNVPVTKDGPWGGDSGREYDITELPLDLESVTIGSGDVVDSLAFSYIDQAGNKRTVGPWGGDGGTKTKIPLAPTETVTKMAGTTADFNGNIVVTSISFATNLRTYGPYGIEKGNKFNTAAGDNIIVGFYARAGFQLNSIGVYVRKKE